MKKCYLFIKLFILLLLVSCNTNELNTPPVASNGFIDLTGWDFEAQGPLDLKGEWKFKWKEDKPEFILPEYDDSDWENYKMPSVWNENGKPTFGYCWYRLGVKLNPSKGLVIFLLCSNTAYIIYINGEQILSNGQAGNSRETSIPQLLAMSNTLPQADTLVIARKMSNFHNFLTGGPSQTPKIGLSAQIQKDIWNNDFFNILVLGIIFMMALYHILLWLGRREDLASLLFAAFCLIIFMRMMQTTQFSQRLLPESSIFIIRTKIEYISISLGWTVFITFLSRLFPKEFKNKLLTIFQIAGIIISLFMIFTPIYISSMFLTYIQIILLIIGVWLIFLIIIAIKNKRSDAGIVLGGIIGLFITVLNDVLHSQAIIHTGFIIQIGLIFFIFCLSAILSLRFARAYKKADHLSKNLEQEVKEQTKIITEKNEQLRRLNQEKTDYFINLAHETRTPLTLIANYLKRYILKKGMDPDLTIINNNIENLKKNMVNFLDYEKLERGQDFYDHENITDLTTTLVNSINLFKEMAGQKQITINSNIEKDIGIRADPYAVDRIINNILDNAIKYTDKGGSIDIRLKTKKNEIELMVKDTGIGIAEEQLENIFKSYYQISHEKKNIQGIGMGLNIAKKIIDDIGGRIEVVSVLGQGSVFRIYFNKPTGQKKQMVSIKAEDTAQPITPEYKKLYDDVIEKADKNTILVVEDNPDMLMYLKDALNEYYNVYCAQNGKEALEKLESMHKINLVVSDIMMDKMDGYQFYEEVMKDERYRAVPVIFLTAKNTQYEKVKALKKGVLDFINKPFDIEELRAKIYSAIRLAESQFERSKAVLINKVIKSLDKDIGQDNFSLMFEKRCFEYDISSREKEIILLLLEGKKYKEIADALFIAENTVKYHVKNIYDKCKITRRIELVLLFKI